MPPRRTPSAQPPSPRKAGAKNNGRNNAAPLALTAAQFRSIHKAISDPRRYEILQRIARQEHCTCADLRQCSPITAATLSHHLKELRAAGLISIARRGKFALPRFRREVWKNYLAQLSQL
ncbi:MAG TPA: metalloregulator ArsR/SmtB family transcription factor [Terriglobales bacterium]|nr:metalloregulator ArsR/SmtB family transcription factor [Terriglobales bacterium]